MSNEITKGTIGRLEAPFLITNPTMKVRVQSVDGENITLSSKDVELGSMPTFDDAYDFSHLPRGERVTLRVVKCSRHADGAPFAFYTVLKRLKVTSKMGGLIMVSPR